MPLKVLRNYNNPLNFVLISRKFLNIHRTRKRNKLEIFYSIVDEEANRISIIFRHGFVIV